jgi:hypothetical protein
MISVSLGSRPAGPAGFGPCGYTPGMDLPDREVIPDVLTTNRRPGQSEAFEAKSTDAAMIAGKESQQGERYETLAREGGQIRSKVERGEPLPPTPVHYVNPSKLHMMENPLLARMGQSLSSMLIPNSPPQKNSSERSK